MFFLFSVGIKEKKLYLCPSSYGGPYLADMIYTKRYARLIVRNVRNFDNVQVRRDGSRCLSVDCLLYLHIRVFSRPLKKDMAFQRHASFV